MSERKVAILGATKGMGRSLARRFVERGDSVVILGRDTDEVSKSCDDLRSRAAPGVKVSSAMCDLEVTPSFASALDSAEQALDGIDTIVVTAGLFGTQEQLEDDADRAQRVLTVDFANTIVFCEEAKRRLLARGGGTLCVFSSVAGDRARKPVVMYGAAKAGLSAYLEGLDHKHRSDGLITVCVKPGFVKTSMTEGLKVPPFAGDPDEVALDVLKGIDAKSPVVYAPPIWKFVMTGIKLLPRFVMRRIKF
jgi:decaprenylphospho-beta-D-erythro-pentofuranosid-2-ulose 2-reductase